MAKRDEYQTWAQHFGKSTQHPDVAREFTSAKAKAPVIKRDMLAACIGFHGITINFADPVVVATKEEVKPGVGILYGIALHLTGSEIYRGPLPYDFKPGESQASVRKRLGRPGKSSVAEKWDEWKLDGKVLTVTYDEANVVEAIAVFLPEK